VITARRDKTQKKLESDQIVCPACHSQAQKIENIVGTKSKPETTTQFVCPNEKCRGILKEKLKHFVSKNCMNIASIGESIIDMLVDQDILHSLSNIYTLTQPEKIFLLKRLPGIADKKIESFIDEIKKSKSNPFWRFLNGIGISGIGIKLAKEIEKALAYRPTDKDITSLDQLFIILPDEQFL
jgi:DNA ligase (NAD+)